MLEMNMIILTALMLFAPGTAHAYFDAGTASIIMQGFVGAVTFIVVFWGKMKVYIQSFFSRDKGVSPSVGADTIVGSDEHTGVDADAENRQ